VDGRPRERARRKWSRERFRERCEPARIPVSQSRSVNAPNDRRTTTPQSTKPRPTFAHVDTVCGATYR
jgi:hypothetical protein